jgi:hypothetical protein
MSLDDFLVPDGLNPRIKKGGKFTGVSVSTVPGSTLGPNIAHESARLSSEANEFRSDVEDGYGLAVVLHSEVKQSIELQTELKGHARRFELLNGDVSIVRVYAASDKYHCGAPRVQESLDGLSVRNFTLFGPPFYAVATEAPAVGTVIEVRYLSTAPLGSGMWRGKNMAGMSGGSRTRVNDGETEVFINGEWVAVDTDETSDDNGSPSPLQYLAALNDLVAYTGKEDSPKSVACLGQEAPRFALAQYKNFEEGKIAHYMPAGWPKVARVWESIYGERFDKKYSDKNVPDEKTGDDPMQVSLFDYYRSGIPYNYFRMLYTDSENPGRPADGKGPIEKRYNNKSVFNETTMNEDGIARMYAFTKEWINHRKDRKDKHKFAYSMEDCIGAFLKHKTGKTFWKGYPYHNPHWSAAFIQWCFQSKDDHRFLELSKLGRKYFGSNPANHKSYWFMSILLTNLYQLYDSGFGGHVTDERGEFEEKGEKNREFWKGIHKEINEKIGSPFESDGKPVFWMLAIPADIEGYNDLLWQHDPSNTKFEHKKYKGMSQKDFKSTKNKKFLKSKEKILTHGLPRKCVIGSIVMNLTEKGDKIDKWNAKTHGDIMTPLGRIGGNVSSTCKINKNRQSGMCFPWTSKNDAGVDFDETYGPKHVIAAKEWHTSSAWENRLLKCKFVGWDFMNDKLKPFIERNLKRTAKKKKK